MKTIAIKTSRFESKDNAMHDALVMVDPNFNAWDDVQSNRTHYVSWTLEPECLDRLPLARPY